jgi:hypothetical protein
MVTAMCDHDTTIQDAPSGSTTTFHASHFGTQHYHESTTHALVD